MRPDGRETYALRSFINFDPAGVGVMKRSKALNASSISLKSIALSSCFSIGGTPDKSRSYFWLDSGGGTKQLLQA